MVKENGSNIHIYGEIGTLISTNDSSDSSSNNHPTYAFGIGYEAPITEQIPLFWSGEIGYSSIDFDALEFSMISGGVATYLYF